MTSTKEISLPLAFLPVLVLVPLLGLNVFLFGDNSLGGANQLALLIAAAVGVTIGISKGFTLVEMIRGIEKNIASTIGAILILLMIGALAGSWLISGVVPAFIVYGLKILHPSIFLVATSIICALISLASGSSWSTIATIGIALLGIGKALGFPEAMTAGAIISGAYFGDKMSPLSDTTNLAAAMAGTDLFKHINYMMYTTIPSFAINLIAFAVIGFGFTPGDAMLGTGQLSAAIETSFNISPWLFIVPIAVIYLIIKKVKPLIVLFIGAILGCAFAAIFQAEVLRSLSQNSSSYLESIYTVSLNAMGSSTTIDTGNPEINDLLSTGGMSGMLNTVWLILCAMAFGGVLDAIGALQRITSWLIKGVSSTTGIVTTTAGSSLFLNFTASDQYLAIVVPGKMYREIYEENKLEPENLSRTLEDSGTVTSVLIPWNTCGATQSAVLGVATFTYLPFCFFNYLSPIMTIVFARFNIKIARSAE